MRLPGAGRAAARGAGGQAAAAAARAPVKLASLDQSHRTVLALDGGGFRGLLTGAAAQRSPPSANPGVAP